MPESAVGHHAGFVFDGQSVFHYLARIDDTGQPVHDDLVFVFVRLEKRQYAAVAAVVGYGRCVEDIVLFEPVDIGQHPVIERIGGGNGSPLVEFELHRHAVFAGDGAGFVQAAVGDRLVEEVVGLLISHVESQAFPVLVAFGLPVGNPVKKFLLRVDIFAERDGQVAAMVGVFGDPIEAREFQVFVPGFFEPRDQLVDIPFGCGDLVFVFREVHPAAIQFAPVFLVAHGFGKSQHDLMPERRFADLCDLLADASVQRGKRLALVEDAVQEPLPFGFAGKFFLIPDGVAAARAVFEFEEQESVEKPMNRRGIGVRRRGGIRRPSSPAGVSRPDRSARGPECRSSGSFVRRQFRNFRQTVPSTRKMQSI